MDINEGRTVQETDGFRVVAPRSKTYTFTELPGWLGAVMRMLTHVNASRVKIHGSSHDSHLIPSLF